MVLEFFADKLKFRPVLQSAGSEIPRNNRAESSDAQGDFRDSSPKRTYLC